MTTSLASHTSQKAAIVAGATRTDLLVKLFSGLGDPTGCGVLQLLGSYGELSAGEPVKCLGIPQAIMSTPPGLPELVRLRLARRDYRFVSSFGRRARQRADRHGESLLEDDCEHAACCSTIRRPVPHSGGATHCVQYADGTCGTS